MIRVDRHTIIQVLGGLMNKPDLLSDTDKYRLEVSDFPTTMDKFIYSAIHNLYNDGEGANNIRAIDVINYLKENVSAAGTLEKENGEAFLQDCEVHGESSNFNYYYQRLKKLNLLRDLEIGGRNVEMFYCENPLNPDCQSINDRFDKASISDIINVLKGELDRYENKYVLTGQIEESTAYEGIMDLVEELKIKPEVGCKLQGDILNSITRGGRKGKLYLRSAGSGVGKTRSMVGDACNIAYPIRFDRKKGKWVSTGSCEKVLYVMTEQDPEEIKTMILSYLTGYNEEIFVYGTYGDEEMPRIKKAIDIMEKYKDNMLFARIADPCASTVKNLFRRYNFQKGVENFFYDYIFSSPAMLNEYRDIGIREDVALRLFTTALKNLAVELNAFIMTSTQVSNDDNEKGGFRDQRQVQGSKAIVNLVDFACIMSRPTKEELQELAGFQGQFSFTPNLVTDVYKNRRGRWNMIRIWSYVDLGCCRREDLFVTTPNMKPIKDFKVISFETTRFKDYSDLCKLYNEGEVTDEVYDEFYSPEVSDFKPEDIVTNAAAFEDKADMEKRLSNKSFASLLEL